MTLETFEKIAIMKEFRKQRVLFPKGKKIQHACCFDLVIRITHEHTNLIAVVEKFWRGKESLCVA